MGLADGRTAAPLNGESGDGVMIRAGCHFAHHNGQRCADCFFTEASSTTHRPALADILNFTIPSEPWMVDARCAATPGAQLGDFFPRRGASLRRAKTLCASCDVRGECLAYAIDNGIEHGVWGGVMAPAKTRAVAS